MAVGSSILAWKIPWIEEPGAATVHGITKSQVLLSTQHKGLLLCNSCVAGLTCVRARHSSRRMQAAN